MAFDYYIKASKTGMHLGAAAIAALYGTHRQLGRLFPGLSRPRPWAREGITLLPGIDDYPKKTEVTHPGDGWEVAQFARAHELLLLCIWAIQRDNGGCPGTIDSNSCSGIEHRGGRSATSSRAMPTGKARLRRTPRPLPS